MRRAGRARTCLLLEELARRQRELDVGRRLGEEVPAHEHRLAVADLEEAEPFAVEDRVGFASGQSRAAMRSATTMPLALREGAGLREGLAVRHRDPGDVADRVNTLERRLERARVHLHPAALLARARRRPRPAGTRCGGTASSRSNGISPPPSASTTRPARRAPLWCSGGSRSSGRRAVPRSPRNRPCRAPGSTSAAA